MAKKKKRRTLPPMWARTGSPERDVWAKGGHTITGSSHWCVAFESEMREKQRICGFHTRWQAQRYIGLNWDRESRQKEKPKVVHHQKVWKWKR